MHEHWTARFQSASMVKMRDRVSFAGVTSFENSRKEEKNYMKPVQTETGSNRFEPVQTGSIPRYVTKSAP